MFQRWRSVCGTAGCFALVLSLAACDSAKEKITESLTEAALEKVIEGETGKAVKVDTNGKGVIIESKDGAESVRLDTSSGQLPADWPARVPVYPGGKITMSIKTGKGWTLTLETADTPEKVTEFYKSKFSGLEQRASMEIGGNRTLMWVDQKDPMQITLTVANDDKTRTNVFLMVGNDKAASK